MGWCKEPRRRTDGVLRISVNHRSQTDICLQLEGRIIGPWVEELRRLSEDALAQGKKVTLDLEKVWFVDQLGITLLQDLAQKQVPQLNCSPFVSQQLKEVVL
jgi:anti-anti-sigma regulatory factor